MATSAHKNGAARVNQISCLMTGVTQSAFSRLGNGDCRCYHCSCNKRQFPNFHDEMFLNIQLPLACHSHQNYGDIKFHRNN